MMGYDQALCHTCQDLSRVHPNEASIRRLSFLGPISAAMADMLQRAMSSGWVRHNDGNVMGDIMDLGAAWIAVSYTFT